MPLLRFSDRTVADKGLLIYCNTPVAWNAQYTWIHITVHGCDDLGTSVCTNKAWRTSRVSTCVVSGFMKASKHTHDGSSTTSVVECVLHIRFLVCLPINSRVFWRLEFLSTIVIFLRIIFWTFFTHNCIELLARSLLKKRKCFPFLYFTTAGSGWGDGSGDMPFRSCLLGFAACVECVTFKFRSFVNDTRFETTWKSQI